VTNDLVPIMAALDGRQEAKAPEVREGAVGKTFKIVPVSEVFGSCPDTTAIAITRATMYFDMLESI